MAEIVNLRQARKTRERAEAMAAADENAARFDRSKALKVLERTRAEKVRAELDAHKREPE